MKKSKTNEALRATNLESYKALNELSRAMGDLAHDDFELFSTLSTMEQVAVVAYRSTVDHAATSKDCIDRWLALVTVTGEMTINNEDADINELLDFGHYLITSPQVRFKRDGKAIVVDDFLVVRVLGLDLVFKGHSLVSDSRSST